MQALSFYFLLNYIKLRIPFFHNFDGVISQWHLPASAAVWCFVFVFFPKATNTAGRSSLHIAQHPPKASHCK